MSLTTGRGPLSASPAGVFSAPVPKDLSYVEPYQRRVHATRDGSTVVDSERVVLVHRAGAPAVYGFPSADVRDVESRPIAELTGYVEVPWGAVDGWFEEGAATTGHPRSPYHRVDCVPTSRHLRAELGGTVLVDTTDTVGVYETTLAPRLYVDRRHVRMDLLVPSATTTYCPYKGTASYWSAVVDGDETSDVAWCYEDPYDECRAITGLLSFYETQVTLVTDLPQPAEL